MLPTTSLLRAAAGSLLVLLLAAMPVGAHDDPTEQIDDLSVALNATPRDLALLHRRADLLREVGRWKDARADLDRAARLSPGHPDVDRARGRLLLETHEPAHAKSALDRVLARHPDDGEALVLRGRAWLALGDTAGAVRDYDRALAVLEVVTPDHVLERARLAVRDPDSALAILDRGIARLGPAVSLEDEAIRLEIARGRFDDALVRLDRIAPQFGRRESVQVRRAELLARLGRADEAREAARDALDAIAALTPRQRGAPTIASLAARAETLLTPSPPTSGSPR